MTTMQPNRMAEAQHGNGTTAEKSDFEKMLEKPILPFDEELSRQMGMPKDKMLKSMRRSCMPRDASDDDFDAFVQIASKYRLNPFAREIFAMPKKGGGIQIVVPVDGWVSIIQRNKNHDGWDFQDLCDDDGEFAGTKITIYRKDQAHPTTITEWYSECRRDTEPWKQYPRRMTRHKAIIQGGRVAYGLSGISDEEEGATAAGYASLDEALKESNRPERKERNPFQSGDEPTNPIPEAPPVPQQGTAVAPAAKIEPSRQQGRPQAPQPAHEAADIPDDAEAEYARINAETAALAESGPTAAQNVLDDPKVIRKEAEAWVKAESANEANLREYVNSFSDEMKAAACKTANVPGVTAAHPFKNVTKVAFVLRVMETTPAPAGR